MACRLFYDKKEDKQEYAYEKAIDVHWYYVNHYHIWMNSVEYNEEVNNLVDKLLIIDVELINPFPSDEVYRLPNESKFVKSITIITNRFICFVNIVWFLLSMFSVYLDDFFYKFYQRKFYIDLF